MTRARAVRRAAAASALAALALPIAAEAQNGAMWVDRQGRLMSLTIGGQEPQPPAPTDRTAGEMADLFNRLCVAASSDPAAEGLTPAPFTFGFARPPLVLDVWHKPGLVLSRSERFFATQRAQCTTVFYVNTLPDRQAVQDAVSAIVGSQPTNAARAMRRNGRPNPRFVPEWRNGTSQIVIASVGRDSQFIAGDRVQLSIRTQ